MLCSLYRRDQFAIHERILAFHDRLKERYPDVRACRLFHLISGSTVWMPIRRFDFQGEDSIEAFIRREYAAVFGRDRLCECDQQVEGASGE